MVLWPVSISVSEMTPAIRLTTGIPLVALSCHKAGAESLWSQFVDPDDGRFSDSKYAADTAYGFLSRPIIITDPAVNGELGAVGLFFHESEEQKEKRLGALQNGR